MGLAVPRMATSTATGNRSAAATLALSAGQGLMGFLPFVSAVNAPINSGV